MKTPAVPRRLAPLVSACLLLLLIATACNSSKDEGGGSGTAEGASAAPASEAAASKGKGKFKAKDADGSEVVSIELGSTITISYGGKTVTGRKKGSKRTYQLDGKVIAIAKSDGEKVKLKDEGGKLLWKIKFKSDKVKISDNEEGDDAYSVKIKGDDFKVKHGDDTLGKVKFYADDGRIKVKDADGGEKFKVKTDKSSAMWGVLLLKDIPEPLRFVVMAEIGARGR